MKSINQLPIDWFACPVTKQTLRQEGDCLVSGAGRYQKFQDCWDFMPKGADGLDDPKWKSWEVLQSNGVAGYENDPENNLGIGARRDFLEFAEFCGFHGRVLDVGVGPQFCPTHIEYCNIPGVHFVGVDPLIGVQPRGFDFVRALGEYLPFRDGLFDQVLFVTTLDHFVDPGAALREAKRVLAQNGEICIWLGEKSKDAPKPTKSHSWYEGLKVPDGADDLFHFERLSRSQLDEKIALAGLVTSAQAVAQIDPWRTNIHYKVKRA